jgi:gas vesicle protein
MMDSKNAGKVVASLLVGVAIGSIIGVLFAPDKGKNLRKKIVFKTDDLSRSLKKKMKAMKAEAKAGLKSKIEKAEKIAEQAMN